MHRTSNLFVTIVLAAAAAACGSGDDKTDGGTTSASCGLAGAKTGTECSGLADCGSGTQNFVKVAFCEHCLARADTHFCEAGTCRAFDIMNATNIEFNFTLPQGVTTAQSFTIASVNPLMADGTQVTCAALTSTCDSTDNSAINARNSRYSPLPMGDFFEGLISIDPGQGRMLFLQLTSDVQGKGTVLAHGCKDGIDVTAGTSPTPVTIDVVKL